MSFNIKRTKSEIERGKLLLTEVVATLMALVSKNLRENDQFYYVEGAVSVKDVIKQMAKEMTVNAVAGNGITGATSQAWELIFPTDIETITNRAVLKTTTTFNKTFYFEMSRPITAGDETAFPLTYLNLAVGTEWNDTDSIIPAGSISPVTKFSWYMDDIDPSIKSWLPVTYWMNVTKDAVNMVFRGDPSADIYPYEKFLVGHAYIGALKPLDADQTPDVDYNFGITASSSTEPILTTLYGPRTGTGITDVCMVGSKSGMPYQPHYPAFYTANPYMDKINIEGSRWNNQKHQFSDVTLVHPVDMERGKLANALIGDDSSLFDNDKLVFKQKTIDQEMYRKFKISAQYSFLNNSANVHYCIAIRCYNDDGTVQVDDLT